MSCMICKHNQRGKRDRAHQDIIDTYGIKDLYRNGWGWWSTPETMADILARQVAWNAIKFVSPKSAAYLCNYNLTPASIIKIPVSDIAKLHGLGKVVAQKLHDADITEQTEELFQKAYNGAYHSWCLEHALKNFERVGKKKREVAK